MSEAKFAALRGVSRPTAATSSRTTLDDVPTATRRTGPYHSHVSRPGPIPHATPAAVPARSGPPEYDGVLSEKAAYDELPLYRERRQRRGFAPLPAAQAFRRKLASSKLKAAVIGVAGLFYVLHLLASTHGHLSGRWHGRKASPWKSSKTNVILMISDGFGPAGETFARSFAAALDPNIPDDPYAAPQPLALDDLLLGTHRSRSSSSLITDSAAGATAFSCGLKSYNGAIGVDSDGRKCGTLFEAAKKQRGMLTGVVVTSRLTDATPAAFASHASSRALEADIAMQEVLGTIADKSGRNGTARVLDLAIGGGGCNFMRQGHPMSCRTDDVDLISDAQALDWNVWAAWPLNWTRGDAAPIKGLHAANGSNIHAHALSEPTHDASLRSSEMLAHINTKKPKLPFLGLLAPANTPYEIDRIAIPEDQRPPSLSQLAGKALQMLDSDPSNRNGFVLMIEGSQIDLCAHSNDGACHAREILAYQEAISTVRDFVDKKNAAGERTILISTSDHETGGLTLGRQLTKAYPNYAWYPQRLLGAKQSAQVLSAELVAFVAEETRSAQEIDEYVRAQTLGERGAGFTEQTGGPPTDEEVRSVAACIAPPGEARTAEDPPIDISDICKAYIADAMSRRAEIGWSTSGHTGIDINVFGRGPGVERLRGNIENTDIGAFIEHYLSLDLAKITTELA